MLRSRVGGDHRDGWALRNRRAGTRHRRHRSRPAPFRPRPPAAERLCCNQSSRGGGLLGRLALSAGCSPLPFPPSLSLSLQAVFTQIELVSTIVFTLEYIIRIACCPCENYGVLRFVFNVQNIIDLLAFLPFWVTAIAKIFNPDGDGSGLGFLRVIRLIRVFRVFKFGKYSAGIQMFAGAIGKSTQPLSILLFTFCLAVIILSSVMYMVEGAQSDTNSTAYNEELLNMAGFDQSVHQYCFGSIPRCFWWAIVTMTTVGYGDCYPVSTMGKCLAMLTMLLGVLILALPITVVGSNFQKMVEMYEEESGMRREFDQNEDGDIDEAELRQFLLAKRKDNALRKVDINGKSIDLNPERLMLKYDPQGNGKLNFEEFQNLKRDIIDPAAADPQANIRILLKRTADTEERVAMIEEHLLLIGKHLGVAPPPPKREASLSDFSGELGGSSDATRSAAGAGG